MLHSSVPKKLTILLIPFFLFAAFPAGAQNSISSPETQTILLQDGSVLRGKLVGVENGNYIIQTEKLGTVKVAITDLKSLSAGNQPPKEQALATPAAMDPAITEKIKQLQSQVLSDPSLMAQLQDLLKDPEIKSILEDKSFMEDVTSMDPARVQKNSATQKLLTNPKIQQIIELLQGKQNP